MLTAAFRLATSRLGPSGGMVDAEDSKSSAARHVGSSPTLGTNVALLGFLHFASRLS